MAELNRKIKLAARPAGMPKTSDFELVESVIPEPAEGEVLVRTLYLSVDPYQRGRMNEGRSYAKGVEIGEVMIGGVVGEVAASRHSNFQEGEFVNGDVGWQTHGIVDGKHLRKVDPDVAPISTALGVLGMPGMTAYFGLLEVGSPGPGETVVVSGAAGAVGSLAGQIAKIKGCRVVGISGSEEKVNYVVNDLGFDAACNYKETKDYRSELERFCPKGIDVYFDNVGGKISDAIFPQLNLNARVAVCGQISQYNLERPERGPRFLWHLIVKRARVEGFLVFDFEERFPEALRQMATWVQAGEVNYREDVVEGLENAPSALIGMLQGENIGKRLVKVADR